jgi:hypothetical protein
MFCEKYFQSMDSFEHDSPPVKRYHDAPWLTIRNTELLGRFLQRFDIDARVPGIGLINRVTEAFSNLPFENLTKIIKAGAVTSASSAMRYPDELIFDFLSWGTGGTCFSLTASLVAIFDALGIEAYPTLADRHYGPNTHCGVLIPASGGEILLCDPGYLLFAPVKIPKDRPVSFNNGFNVVELLPLAGGTRMELYTVVKGNRKLRLTFKIEPVSDDAFGKAWEQSFAFEMMSYPVLTRTANGCHQYLQANTLAIRDSQRTRRQTLTPESQIQFITATAGIHRDIALRALEIVKYGLDSAAAAR